MLHKFVGLVFAIICGIQKYLAVTFYVNSLQLFELVTKCPSQHVTFHPSLDKLFSWIIPQLYIYQEFICSCGIDNFVPVFFCFVRKSWF